MRKKERAVTDRKEIESIIQSAEVVRLGFAVENVPYVVPVNFGYEDGALYVHCAQEGRKLDMIRQNNLVCFEVDIDSKILDEGDVACKWTSNTTGSAARASTSNITWVSTALASGW